MKPAITKENIKDMIYNKVQDEYTLLTKYINTNTKVKMKHNKCGHEWDIIPREFIHRGRRCPRCSHRSYKRTIEEYSQEVNDITNGEYKVLGTEYKNNKTGILMEHIECGHTWHPSPNDFINGGKRCPECAGNVRKDLTYVKNKVKDIYGKGFTLLTKVYKNNKQTLIIKHNECGNTFPTTLVYMEKSKGMCPHCTEGSKGSILIENFLKENNIEYIKEAKFKDLYNIKNNRKYKLRFDFYLPDYRLLIEFDGEFHERSWYKDDEKHLLSQQENDRKKDKWVKRKKVSLLRISYHNINNIALILNELLINESSTTIERYNLTYIE